jgi:hypothetical protein
MSTTELVRQESDSTSLMRLIEQVALDPTVDAAKLGALLDVKLRWEADESRKAYAMAITEFKRRMPKIVKYKEIRDKQGKLRSRWAPLDYICEKCIPVLVDLGLTHRWASKPLPDGWTEVTCFLKHESGHEEHGASMSAPPDKNDYRTGLQDLGSTYSYLQRYTLVASLGLPIFDDSDGNRPSTGKMEDSKHLDWLAKIEGCSSIPELNDAWKAAAKAAKEAQDNESLNAFTAAAGKRKNAIIRSAA